MNIYVINTTIMGLNIISYLKKRISIKGIIGLSKRESTDEISGYVYQEEYCRDNKIGFLPIETYTLRGKNDKENILALDIDVLIVIGWQRLIPEWLIKHVKVCVVGAHGSPHGISHGRGRSPQNWALILGNEHFYISIFKIDAGIDSGEIIDTKYYTLSKYDDINTSHYKAGWLIGKMIADNILNNKILAGTATPQEGKAQYLPQRLPEDGKIDWSRTSEEIYNFIRGLTRPYPGAFSSFSDYRIIIWKGNPFHFTEDSMHYTEGEVVRIFSNGELLIKTGDSFFLVSDYSVEPEIGGSYLEEQIILSSADFKEQIKRIVDRHYEKYPDFEISDDIMTIIE